MASEFTHDAIFDSLVEAMEDAWSKKNIKQVCGQLRKLQDKIRRRYEKIRMEAKEKYMEKSRGLLDRHKCAAAFMIAFLMEIPESNTTRKGQGFVREKLAITVGLTVLAIFVTEDEPTKENKKFTEYLKNNNGFKFPQNRNDKNPYSKNWATELYHARVEKKLFLPSLAHELFYIERYNKMACALGEEKMCNMGW